VSDQRCEHCGGVGRVGLPRGMSPGFYAFVAAGCRWEDEGTEMVCPRCDGGGKATIPPALDVTDKPAG
jgi:DnaJ-class molecular chaperone